MSKDIQQLTVEELEKKLSTYKGLMVSLAVVMILSFCVTMYAVVALNKIALISLIALPLGMLPLLITNAQQSKKVKAELVRRA